MKKRSSPGKLQGPFKLSKALFVEFCDEFAFWQNKFGLTDWEISFEFSAYSDSSRAAVTINNLEDRLAGVFLSPEWDIKPTAQSVRAAAFHEACELLLMRSFVLACSRSVSEQALIEESHVVIRRLENSIFIESFKQRFPNEAS